MHVEVISTAELGDRSYVVDDGEVAVVVDPQRDLDRVEAVLTERGVRCELVVETHIHNDYVTGGYELARRHGCRYAVSADDEVAYEREAVRDGDELEAGSLRVRVVATPGHTDTHLSYAVTDVSEPDAAPAVFTGGSLLYGSVGRTDLIDVARTDELTRAQFHSARRLAAELPDETEVFPTHGFGSFCSSGSAAGGDGGTIGGEKQRNDALVTDDEDAFVEALIANLTAYPAYYAHMAPLNRQGPGAPDLSLPRALTAEDLRSAIEEGSWVVDLRDRVAYAGGHIAGTVGIPAGGQFSTYVGWLMPWGAKLTIIGDSEEDVTTAQRDLSRIGIDELSGQATGDISSMAGDAGLAEYRRATFEELASETTDDGGDGPRVLDVRRDDEFAGSSIRGALHVPLHSLLERMDEVPDEQVWVHCASGYRAAIASSLLARAGHDVVYIDDDYSTAESLGLTG